MQVLRVVIECFEEEGNDFGSNDLDVFFAGEINPVGAKAQKKVPVPEGLDLDAWINEPPPESESESEDSDASADANVFMAAMEEAESSSKKGKKKNKKKHKKAKSAEEPTEEEIRQSKEQRLLQQVNDPNYLKDVPSKSAVTTPVEEIPIQTIDLGVPLHIPGLASADQYLNISRESSVQGDKKKKKRKKSKKKKNGDKASDDEDVQGAEAVPDANGGADVVVRKVVEVPEGARDSDDDHDDGDNLAADDPHRALADVRLDDLEYNEPYKPKYESGQGADYGADNSIPFSLFGGEGVKKEKKSKSKSKEDGEKGEKKKKKKKKKEEELVNGEEEGKKKKKKKKDKKEEEKVPEEVPDTDNMDFWLSNTDVNTVK